MFFCFPATKSTLEGIAVSSGGGLIPIEGTWQKRFLCLDLCISEPVMPCYISIFCTLCSGLEDGKRHTPQPIPQFHPTISVKKIDFDLLSHIIFLIYKGDRGHIFPSSSLKTLLTLMPLLAQNIS